MIPFVDLGRQPKDLKTEIKKKIDEIINSSDFILGKEVGLFEKEFARYIGTKYCIGVASGTDAILLSLRALGIGSEDEVIVPAFTFVATVSPLIMLGAKPVFVDIEDNLPLIDVSKIEKAITPKTKAIIPVHLYGFPAKMTIIMDLAKKYNIKIVEDACQAHGSEFRGRKMGSFGDVNAFSFYPSKNLGAWGDAGAITTSDKNLYEKLLSLRHHGQREKYIHLLVGYTSRLDTVQAAVLKQKLKYLDSFNKERREIAQIYDNLLKDLPLRTLHEENNTKGNYHIYAIRTKKRNELFEFLNKKGISCGIHYPAPLYLQPALKNLNYKEGDFPNSEAMAKECLSLPIFPGMTSKEAKMVVSSIKEFYK